MQVLHHLLVLVLCQAKEVVFGTQGILLIGVELIEVLDCLRVLHLVAFLLTGRFALTVLALTLLVERAADEGLVHLLVGVELVDVVQRWALRDDDATGGAQVVELVLRDVGASEHFGLGLLGRCSGGDALISQLWHDVSAHRRTDLKLVLSRQAAQVLEIRSHGLADHD